MVCKRIRLALAEQPIDLDGRSVLVTMSAGIVALDPENECESVDALLSRADKALYQAKAAGRNRTEMR